MLRWYLVAAGVAATMSVPGAQPPPAITQFDPACAPHAEASLDPATFVCPGPIPAIGVGGTLGQLELRPIGGGAFRLAASVTNANACAGGAGGWDLIEGTYTPGAVPGITNLAAGLNTAGDEFSFSISNDGCVAVYDDFGAGPMLSRRPPPCNGPWPAPAPIIGLPAGAGDSKVWNDPASPTGYAFAFIDPGGGISMGILDPVVPAVFAIAVAINPIPGAITMHSHHPVQHPTTWEHVGWIVSAAFAGGDSDSYWVGWRDDTNHPPLRIYDDAGWQSNPTTLGESGTTYWASTTVGPGPAALPLIACNGYDVPGGGGVISLRTFVPHGPDPWATVLVLGPSTPEFPVAGTIGNVQYPAGLPCPPAPLGRVAILPLTTVTALALPFSGGATVTAPVPCCLPPIDFQCAAANLVTGEIFIGNAAQIY